MDVEDKLRIVLIGNTEAGKSSTGNSILGYEDFKSKSTGSFGALKCKREKQSDLVDAY
jgi:predicted GTPase